MSKSAIKQKHEGPASREKLAVLLALALAILSLPLALRAETPPAPQAPPPKHRLSISISTDDVGSFKDLLTQMKSDSDKSGAHITNVLLFTDQIDKVSLNQGISQDDVRTSTQAVFNTLPPEKLISIDSNDIPRTPAVAELLTPGEDEKQKPDHLNQYVKNVQEEGTLVSLVTSHAANPSPTVATLPAHARHRAAGTPGAGGTGTTRHSQAQAPGAKAPGTKGTTAPGTGTAPVNGPGGKPVSNGPVSRGGGGGGSSLGGSTGSSSSYSSGASSSSEGSGEKSGASGAASHSSSESHSSGGGGGASGGSSFTIPGGGGGGGASTSVHRGNHFSSNAGETGEVAAKTTSSGYVQPDGTVEAGKSHPKPAAAKQKPAKKKKPAAKSKSNGHRYREFADFK